MQNNDWELIAGEEQHLSQIKALSEAAFHTAFDEEHLHWRYFQNPIDASPITLAVECASQRVIGFYAALPTLLQLGKDRVKGAQVIDTMVHPDYQGKGLFGKMGEHCFLEMAKNDYQAIYGFPNEQAYGGCINRLGWNHSGNIPLWVRPLHKLAHWLPCTHSSHTFGDASASGEALNSLLARLEWEARTNRIARSGEWLQWRYDPRGLRHVRTDSKRAYHWITLTNAQGALEGFCVWGILDVGHATLCELHGTSEVIRAELLGEAVRQAQQQELSLFRAYTQSKATHKLLLKNSFLPLPQKQQPPLIVRHLTAQNPGGGVHNHANWRITGGDMDFQ